MLDVLTIVCYAGMSLPYAYAVARICSNAYFQEKLEYQKQFFKKFNIPSSSGVH